MVVTLKNLLSGDASSKKKLSLLRTNGHMLDERRSELIQHIECLTEANNSYTLKRGPAAPKFVHDNKCNDDTAFRRLARSLELSIAEMFESAFGGGRCGSNLSHLCVRIDLTIRTIMKLINYRASSLWRADRKLTTSRDSWILYDDIDTTIHLFDALSVSIHQFTTTDQLTKQSAVLGLKTPARFNTIGASEEKSPAMKLLLSIENQLLKLRLTVLPSLARRIENLFRCLTTSECSNICISCFKADTFICTMKESSSSMDDKMKFGSKDSYIGDRIIEMLDRNYYSPVKTILRGSNFHLIVCILSEGFNNCLKVLLEQILFKKLRFNQGGVTLLYSILQQLKLWIVEVKEWLQKSSNCSTDFKLIQDMGPWVEANLILGILLTGNVQNKSSRSEELLTSQNKRNRKTPNRHANFYLNSTVVPLRSSFEESCDVTILEKLLPNNQVKKNENLILSNNFQNHHTFSNRIKDLKLRSLDNETCNFAITRLWYHLESMKIFYNFSEMTEVIIKKMENEFFTHDEYLVWASLTITSESKKQFLKFPYMCCGVRIVPRLKCSAVSVCVVLDLNHL